MVYLWGKEVTGSKGVDLKSRLAFVFTTTTQKSMTGTIKKLTDKGFGFIAVDGQKDLFFHSKNLVGVMFDELREGDAVSFESEQSEKGPNAVNVQRA